MLNSRWKCALIAVISFSCATQAQSGTPSGPFEVTSLLGRRLYALPDDGSIAKAREALAADPKNVSLALKLSLAQAGRRQYKEAIATDTAALAANPSNSALYLERGHRELGLRQFPAAQKDLGRAAQLNSGILEVFYHLGLAYYFQGQFRQAAEALLKARALAKSDDSLIDCSAWLYNAYRRAGMQSEAAEVLLRITPAVKNTEPHLFFYLQLLHFYQGKLTVQKTVPPAPATPGDLESELAFNTCSYGVGNWEILDGKPADATALFRNVVKGEAWNAWGFVGSEVALSGPKNSSHRRAFNSDRL